MAAVAVGLTVGSLLLPGCGAGGAGALGVEPTGPLPADVFVAQYAQGSGDVVSGGPGSGAASLSLFSVETGERVRDLVRLPTTSEGSPSGVLSGEARDRAGDVFFALSRGPRLRSGMFDGDPAPGSCGATVYRVDAATGATAEVFHVGGDWQLRAPVPRPDGRAVAYECSPCVPAPRTSVGARTTGWMVVVRDLATDEEVSPSGLVGVPAWDSDGARLVAPAGLPPDAVLTGADVGFVTTDVTAGDTRTGRAPGVLPVPGGGCTVATAFDAAGIAVLSGCPFVGRDDDASLVQLDATGTSVLWSEPTGLCANGMDLVADPAGGRLLVQAAESCGGPGAPADVVQVWTGRQHREVRRYVHPEEFVSGVAW